MSEDGSYSGGVEARERLRRGKTVVFWRDAETPKRRDAELLRSRDDKKLVIRQRAPRIKVGKFET